MPAHEHVNELQFHHDMPDLGGSVPTHRLKAVHPEHGVMGQMLWSSRGIGFVTASPQRQGTGTALWNEGHRLASENQRIPQPKHSSDRTNAGDAWAKSVGGRLPRRTN